MSYDHLGRLHDTGDRGALPQHWVAIIQRYLDAGGPLRTPVGAWVRYRDEMEPPFATRRLGRVVEIGRYYNAPLPRVLWLHQGRLERRNCSIEYLEPAEPTEEELAAWCIARLS